MAETCHRFELVLHNTEMLSVHQIDALFEAGCDDCTVSFCEGHVHLTFDREAPTIMDAVYSAVRDLGKADLGDLYLAYPMSESLKELNMLSEFDLVEFEKIAERLDDGEFAVFEECAQNHRNVTTLCDEIRRLRAELAAEVSDDLTAVEQAMRYRQTKP